ncbi:diguanylate cyclase [Aeromonas jandaei]|uniref:diguanylate cyclase n=1 Tax=Aeromonas jandaei TaxID=650 RepID=UPI00367206FE
MIRFLALLLLTALGSSSVWAAREPLAEPKLSRELQQLEEGSHPERIYRLRVAALAANYDVYPPEIQGRIVRLQCWAMPAERDGEYRNVISFANKALFRARERRDEVTEAGLLTCRAFHQQLLGNMDEALVDYEQALLLAYKKGERLQEAEILRLVGDMFSYQGKLAEGLKYLMEAYRQYGVLKITDKELETQSHIANTYRRIGMYERAEGYFNELEQKYRIKGEDEALADIEAQKGVLYSEMGKYEIALPLLQRAKAYYSLGHNDRQLTWIYIELANIFVNQEKLTDAAIELQKAETILRHSVDTDSVTYAHWQLVMGMVLGAQGDLARAIDFLAKAEPTFIRESNTRFLIRLYELRAQFLEQNGDVREALIYLKRYAKTRIAVDKVLMDQRAMQMRFEFDLARNELAEQELKTRQLLQEAERLKSRERRYWQYLVSGLLLVLLGIGMMYLYRRFRKMCCLTINDELIGIHNRRQITKQGEVWFKQLRTRGPFSVLFFELDYFRQSNEKLNRHVDDCVLMAVANCVKAQLRLLDRVGCYGEGSFLVLLPDTCLDEAVEIAEWICYRVSQLKIDAVPEGQNIDVSIGCAEQSLLDENLGDLVQRADGAMYRAKQAGRNLVMRAE